MCAWPECLGEADRDPECLHLNPPPATVVLGPDDLVKRLEKVERELLRLRPAPRVELGLEATIGMVQACLQALRPQ